VLRAALDPTDPVSSTNDSLTDFIKTFSASNLNANILMMALRTVTNLFTTPEGRNLAASEAPAVINLLARIAGVEGEGEGQAGPIFPENNNLQIALTSAAFNYVVLAFNQRDAIDLEQIMLLCQVAEAVIRRQSDAEVLFRALMTLGMVLAMGGDALDLAKTLEVGEPVGEAAKKAGEERIKAVARECLGFLKG
jgi:phospholipase A-2-activating protein